MKRVFLLFALPFLLAAQDRDGKWRQDLRVLVDTIRTKHPNPYTRTPAEAFDAAVAELDAAIPNLADAQVQAGLASIAALAGDAHTNVMMTQTATGFRRYAFRLRWFDDGLFVTAAPLASDPLIGAKVISIVDRTAEEAHQAMLKFISYENDPWARELSQEYLTIPEMLLAAGILSEAGTVSFKAELIDGRIVTVTAPPLATRPTLLEEPRLARPLFPLSRRNASAPYWFTYLAESRTMYIKYNQCTESQSVPMFSFAQQIADAIPPDQVERVVFDLRDNEGGNSALLEPIIGGVFSAVAQGVTTLPGGVWAIVGRKTFSSATLNAATLKSKGAKLAGEPTGGNPSWFGEVLAVTLPNSRLSLVYSTKKFNIAGFPGPFIDVDLRIPFTSKDYFADRDPWLEGVLAAK